MKYYDYTVHVYDDMYKAGGKWYQGCPTGMVIVIMLLGEGWLRRGIHTNIPAEEVICSFIDILKK